MLIHCTKKLLEELDVKPLIKGEQPLFSWHANLMIINRRKTVVLMNDSNRYVVVLYGLKAKDFKDLASLIQSAIKEVLLEDGVNPDVIERYLLGFTEIEFANTQDRSLVAKLNKSCETVYFYSQMLTTDNLCQSLVSRIASRYGSSNHGTFSYPNEDLYKDLEELAGLQVIQCKAIKIKATLELKNHSVWRRLIIPYNIDFLQFHGILQGTFHWLNYHQHEFEICEGTRRVTTLVQDAEASRFKINTGVLLERGVKLSEYIPKYKRIIYRYDFGDGWEHTIEVEDLVFNHNKNYPECIDGQGNTPPEDVGGESGYDEFLDIINNPQHDEYQHTKDWARMQGYEEFKINNINSRLKFVMNIGGFIS